MHGELGTPWSVLLHCMPPFWSNFISTDYLSWQLWETSLSMYLQAKGQQHQCPFLWLCSSWQARNAMLVEPTWKVGTTMISKCWWRVTFYFSVSKPLGSCAYLLFEFLPWCPSVPGQKPHLQMVLSASWSSSGICCGLYFANVMQILTCST